MIRSQLANKTKLYYGITGIVYKETLDKLDPNYLQVHLLHLGYKAFLSPLHDRDFFWEDDLLDDFWVAQYNKVTDQIIVNGKIRKPKKPHYHVLVEFEGGKSLENDILPIVKELHFANGYFQEIKSRISLPRYFIHLDHKYKAQYNPFDCMSFNGYSPDKAFKFDEDKNFRKEAFNYIISIIDNNNILYVPKLAKLLASSDDQRYFDLFIGCLHRQIVNYIYEKRSENNDRRDAKIHNLEKINKELSDSINILRDSI